MALFDDKLFVADAWNHRILVWNEVPSESGVVPDYVIGQPDFFSGEPNQGKEVSAGTLYWPYGMALIQGRFYVADTGNRRVLGWNCLPLENCPADMVLGQDDLSQNGENRNVGVSASSFRWPHAIAATAETFYVADAGNHRVLAWRPVPSGDRRADFVIGQPQFDSAGEFPYVKQSAEKLRFPYSIACNDEAVFVSDTANNRVLIWSAEVTQSCGAAAVAVLGQPDFASNGENHWKAVSDETLCWPYGICLYGSTLAVADSGNNRVMTWDVSELLSRTHEDSRQRNLICA